MKWLMRNIKVC